VLVLEWTDPAFTAGHWVPDLVVTGGGVPVLADPGADSRRVEWDAVIATDADVVVAAPCGYHLDAAIELAHDLVLAERVPPGTEVWAVDADSYVVRPGPRLVDGAEMFARILHPERVGAARSSEARRIRR
jgi:iron complex transport system substrate-binding protein